MKISKISNGAIRLGIKVVLFSTLLIGVYNNCSQKRFEAYQDDSSSHDDTGQFGNNTNLICPNGAINSPTCTVNAFNLCINGATNPPACNSMGPGAANCLNGAVNPPTCSLSSSGTCINGTTNPPNCNSFGTPVVVCPNGAVNSPACTVNAFNQCINGKTNPPACDAAGGSSSCINGATNFPTCTTNALNQCVNGNMNPPACDVSSGGNTCSNGATNPPTCTVNALNQCLNGNTNPPACDIGTGKTVILPRVFDVIENVSGYLSSYNIKIDMQFNEADIYKKGAIFLFAIFESKIFVCTNPCTAGSTWKEYTGAVFDWSATGLRNEVGVSNTGIVGLQTVFNMTSFDLTTLGGAKIYAGYGLGTNVTSAINEMLAHRATGLPSGRFLEVLTIPKQERNITISGPSGGAPGPLTKYNLWAFISPSYLDYGKSGYFYIFVHNLDNTQQYLYRIKPDNTYEWVLWDGSETMLANSYFKYDTNIKNEAFQFVTNLDVTPFKDWYIYAAYGNGLTPLDASKDCLNNSKFNKDSPFIVK